MKTSQRFGSATLIVAAVLMMVAGMGRAQAQGSFCGQPSIELVETGTGCMLIGQTGTVQDPCCQYEAASNEPENVYAITRDSFNIWVVRDCPTFPTGCTPVRGDDDCAPAPGNSCPPILDEGGAPILEPRTVYLMQVTDQAAGNDWLARPYRGKIHPKAGEIVSVKFGASGGKTGVISAGQDEGIMNALGLEGGLPLPDPQPVP